MARKKKGLVERLTGFSPEFLEELKQRDRGRDDILAEGLDGFAVVLETHGDVSKDDDGDLTSFLRKDARHIYVLQIQVGDGRPPYDLTGSWLIPGYWKGRDWIALVEPGMSVPVNVVADDAERVAIDWDAFEAAGNEKLLLDARQSKLDAQAAAGKGQAMVQSADWIDERVAEGKMTQEQADVSKRAMAAAATGEDDLMPPDGASLRETLEWQLKKGYVDQATYDTIIASNPNLK